jgi:hypothetical protein
MLRLLRRTEEIYNDLKTTSAHTALSSFLEKFLIKYFNFKIRPINNPQDLEKINLYLQNTSLFKQLHSINKSNFNIEKIFNDFIANDDSLNINIGKHLKQEIITNVVLPFAFCLSSKRTKTELILWY